MYQTRINNGKKKAPRHRVLFEPDENEQAYAIVQDMMGNGRVRVLCEDNVKRMARIRGAMRKCGRKVIIEKGDLVIIAMRDFEEDKVDIVHKYNYDEGTSLSKDGVLPPNIQKAWMTSMDVGGVSSVADVDNEQYIVFGEESSSAFKQTKPSTAPYVATTPTAAPANANTSVDAKVIKAREIEETIALLGI